MIAQSCLVSVAAILGIAQTGAAPSQSNGQKEGDNAVEDLFEILESAGELLVEKLRPQEEEADVEHPQWNSLESPRHAVMTFVEAMEHVEQGRDEAWPRARSALGEQSEEEARAAAEDLKAVFDRFKNVRPMQFPGPEEVEKQDIRRFEVFPFAVEHEWIWNKLDEPPRDRIVVRRTGEGQWVFTPETVNSADSLLKSLVSLPPTYDDDKRGKVFLSVFGPTFRDTPWWGWLALLASIAVGVMAGLAVRWGAKRVVNRCEQHNARVLAGVVRSFRTPVALLIFTFALIAGMLFIEFTPTLSAFRWSLVKLMLVIAVGWLFLDLIDLVLVLAQRAMGRTDSPFDDMAVVVLRRSLRVFVLVIFAIFALQNLFGLNLTALLTGMGLAGLALSLAGKDSAKNLFGALTIFINKPFAVGDWIRFKEELGEVEDVGLQSTRIRLLSGEVLVVPNMQFIDHEVENLALRKYLRRQMDIAITYDTPPEKIERAMELVDEVLRNEDIVREGKFDLDRRAPVISFNTYGAYFLNIRAYYWYFIEDDGETLQRHSDRGWFTYLHHCTDVNTRIKAAFNDAGIDFAFPTSTIQLEQADGEQPLAISRAETSDNGRD